MLTKRLGPCKLLKRVDWNGLGCGVCSSPGLTRSTPIDPFNVWSVCLFFKVTSIVLVLLTRHTGLLVTNAGFRAGRECGIIKRPGEDFRTVTKQELDACRRLSVCERKRRHLCNSRAEQEIQQLLCAGYCTWCASSKLVLFVMSWNAWERGFACLGWICSVKTKSWITEKLLDCVWASLYIHCIAGEKERPHDWACAAAFCLVWGCSAFHAFPKCKLPNSAASSPPDSSGWHTALSFLPWYLLLVWSQWSWISLHSSPSSRVFPGDGTSSSTSSPWQMRALSAWQLESLIGV